MHHILLQQTRPLLRLAAAAGLLLFTTTTITPVHATQTSGCQSLALRVIPTCAQPCFLNGAPEIGCASLDFACHCQKQAALYAAVEACVVKSCAESEYGGVIDGVERVCECAVVGSPSSHTAPVSGSYYVSHIPSVPTTASSIFPSFIPSSGTGSGSGPAATTTAEAVKVPAVTPASSKEKSGAEHVVASVSKMGMMGVPALAAAALAFGVL